MLDHVWRHITLSSAGFDVTDASCNIVFTAVAVVVVNEGFSAIYFILLVFMVLILLITIEVVPTIDTYWCVF